MTTSRPAAATQTKALHGTFTADALPAATLPIFKLADWLKKRQHAYAEVRLLMSNVKIAIDLSYNNKNLAIANRSRVSCAHNTLRASIGINITP